MKVGGFGDYGYGSACAGRAKNRQREGAVQGNGQFAPEYGARAANRVTERKNPKTAKGNVTPKWDVACAGNNIVLHGTDTAEGDEAVTAWANVAAGTSMTVYRPREFDPEHPVYKVKMWEESGEVRECMVDIAKVDPANANVLEMFAYSAHLGSSGEYPGALERFLMAQAHQRDSVKGYGAKNLFDKTDWLKVLQEVMQMQYSVGNLKGYLDYKGFRDFLVKEAADKEPPEKEGGKGKEEEARVDTDIQVNPDGSRVLVMTRRIGGMATTTSVEISGPTKLPNDQDPALVFQESPRYTLEETAAEGEMAGRMP